MQSFICSIVVVLIIKVSSNSANNNVESWAGKWFPEKPKEVQIPNNDLDDLFGTNMINTTSSIEDKNKNKTWNGKWFPQPPIEREDVGEKNENNSKSWNGNSLPQKPPSKIVVENNSNEGIVEAKNKETWKGNWFPQNIQKNTEKLSKKSWNGNWFPVSPSSEVEDLTKTIDKNSSGSATEGFTGKPWDGIWFPSSTSREVVDFNLIHPFNQCDNGKDGIDIDFDPEDKRHAYKYLCLAFRANYEPKYSIHPIQQKFIIPPAYEGPSYCLNETIKYEERLPTFGPHRYLAPKYGEYKYLPIQRWMHSLEKGAIVMLYHPCANQMQVESLRNAVRSCLYRHVISPSTLLSTERPLALVAWGTSLEMSVVHLPAVVDFIKENAKHGHRLSTEYDDSNSYEAGIVSEAKLVTDESDSELCPHFEL